MLRERIDAMTAERDRERSQPAVDQIEDLRARLDGAEAERVRLNALLTDQREKLQSSGQAEFFRTIVGLNL